LRGGPGRDCRPGSLESASRDGPQTGRFPPGFAPPKTGSAGPAGLPGGGDAPGGQASGGGAGNGGGRHGPAPHGPAPPWNRHRHGAGTPTPGRAGGRGGYPDDRQAARRLPGRETARADPLRRRAERRAGPQRGPDHPWEARPDDGRTIDGAHKHSGPGLIRRGPERVARPHGAPSPAAPRHGRSPATELPRGAPREGAAPTLMAGALARKGGPKRDGPNGDPQRACRDLGRYPCQNGRRVPTGATACLPAAGAGMARRGGHHGSTGRHQRSRANLTRIVGAQTGHKHHSGGQVPGGPEGPGRRPAQARAVHEVPVSGGAVPEEVNGSGMGGAPGAGVEGTRTRGHLRMGVQRRTAGWHVRALRIAAPGLGSRRCASHPPGRGPALRGAGRTWTGKSPEPTVPVIRQRDYGTAEEPRLAWAQPRGPARAGRTWRRFARAWRDTGERPTDYPEMDRGSPSR